MTAAGVTSSQTSRTTAMLDELLANTLDPGYRQAAHSGRRRRRWERPGAWLGCVLIGLTLVVAYQQSHRSAPARALIRRDLVARIRAVQSDADRREAQAKSLAAQVATLRDAELGGSRTAIAPGQEIAAGTTAVTGPGLRVSVAEPSTTPSPGVTALPRLRDSDIRGVVNRLWAAGAEAIAVNGIRLTPLSSIRVAGETILVDFRPVSSPYSIEAIGNSNFLLVRFADSAEARALQTRKAVDDISFSITSQSRLRLAAGSTSELSQASRSASTAPTASAVPSPR